MSDFSSFHSRLIIRGELALKSPLRIGTGKSTRVTESDQPVVKDSLGNPVIPGSSLKGALRSYTESVLRALQTQRVVNMPLVCDLLLDQNRACVPQKRVETLQDQVGRGEISPEKRDSQLITESCLVCRLFGSNTVAAKLALRDLPVIAAYWGGRFLLRDGVAIDREKGVAATRLKYDFESVPAGTRFEFLMQVDNASDTEMAVTLIATQALMKDQIQLGGGTSRGLGWCCLEKTEFTFYQNPLDYLLGEKGQTLDENAFRTRIARFRDLIGDYKAG